MRVDDIDGRRFASKCEGTKIILFRFLVNWILRIGIWLGLVTDPELKLRVMQWASLKRDSELTTLVGIPIYRMRMSEFPFVTPMPTLFGGRIIVDNDFPLAEVSLLLAAKAQCKVYAAQDFDGTSNIEFHAWDKVRPPLQRADDYACVKLGAINLIRALESFRDRFDEAEPNKAVCALNRRAISNRIERVRVYMEGPKMPVQVDFI